MEQISLSIEELIYSFYSEGFFEQGNALKQTYFGDLADDKMDLLLQASCRSLLAKKLLNYKNHKFTLTKELANVISSLNYSNQSVKASRHQREDGEESVSFHFGENGIIQHSLLFDGQVHCFEKVYLEEVSMNIGDFYRVAEDVAVSEHTIMLSQLELEEMLAFVSDNKKQFENPKFEGSKSHFFEILKKTEGLLNTLLFFEFTEQKEPVVTDVVMFTNNSELNWQIEKEPEDETFKIKESNVSLINNLLKKNIKMKGDFPLAREY